ncbi:MAG: hypothetical protein ACLUSP_02205 [Christensenellales bacterium]
MRRRRSRLRPSRANPHQPCIDFYQYGLGSNSCGPEPLPQYRTPREGKGSITLIVK